MSSKIKFTRLSTGHIQLRYNNTFSDGDRFATGTGVKVENIEHWSKPKQRQKPRTKNASKNNERLNFLESRLSNLITTYQAKSINPTIAELKVEFKKVIGKHKEELTSLTKDNISFIDYIDIFIKNRKNLKTKYSPNTLKFYDNSKNVIHHYLEKKNIKDLSFEQIDLRFKNDFIDYLINIRGVKSLNTVDKYFKFIKLLMNTSLKEKYHTSLDYKDIERKEIRVENIYLTENELVKIYQLDLSNTKGLERARDLFLIGCQTGLRFSDFTNIKTNNFVQTKDGSFIKITIQKTNKTILVPLTPLTKTILEKYNYDLPKAISNQKFNTHLKEIAKRADIDDFITLKTGEGKKSGLKWKFVTTHTARRTFATNAYLNGLDTFFIMAITNHDTEQQFKKYIALTNADKAFKAAKSTIYQESILDRVNRKTTLRKVV